MSTMTGGGGREVFFLLVFKNLAIQRAVSATINLVLQQHHLSSVINKPQSPLYTRKLSSIRGSNGFLPLCFGYITHGYRCCNYLPTLIWSYISIKSYSLLFFFVFCFFLFRPLGYNRPGKKTFSLYYVLSNIITSKLSKCRLGLDTERSASVLSRRSLSCKLNF